MNESNKIKRKSFVPKHKFVQSSFWANSGKLDVITIMASFFLSEQSTYGKVLFLLFSVLNTF